MQICYFRFNSKCYPHPESIRSRVIMEIRMVKPNIATQMLMGVP